MPEPEPTTAFADGLSRLPLESEPTALAAGSSSAATILCRTVGEIGYSSDRERIFADERFGDDDHFSLEPEPTSLTSKLQLPIEKVPLGARVTTTNPNSWDYDDSFPDPDRYSWSKIDLTVHREDGAVVDIQLLRPDQWILDHDLHVGSELPIHIEELEIDGNASVTALNACPDLADGDGEVITGRFVTRQVAETIKITLMDGTELEGTPVHPVWSIDRGDFVVMSELVEGERLQTRQGPLAIRSIELHNTPVPVYNIEVRGVHVYEVTGVGILVHNACPKVVRSTAVEAATKSAARISDDVKCFGQCIEFSKRLERALIRKGVSGTKIRLENQGRRIVDVRGKGRVVGDDLHVAVRVDDTIFDNLNSRGIPFDEWINSLRFLDDLDTPIPDIFFRSTVF